MVASGRHFTQKAHVMLKLFHPRRLNVSQNQPTTTKTSSSAIAFMLCVLCFLITHASQTTLAAQVEDLYVGEATVNSRAAAERREAIQAALTFALVRLTGDANIASERNAQKIIDNAFNYMRSYKYIRLVETVQQPISGWMLHAQFEPAAINAAMEQHGLRAWSAERPKTVLWLAREIPDDPILINPNYHSDSDSSDTEHATYQLLSAAANLDDRDVIFAQQLTTAAHARGLPFALPKMDLADELNVNAQALANGITDNLAVASKRYAADYALTGVIRKNKTESEAETSTQWSINWHLYDRHGKSVTQWQSTTSDKPPDNITAKDVMALLTNYYLEQFQPQQTTLNNTVRPSPEQSNTQSHHNFSNITPDKVVLLVEGIFSGQDFATLTNFFRSIESIEKFNVLTAYDDTMEFSIKLNGTLLQLQRELDLQQSLVTIEAPYTTSYAAPASTASSKPRTILGGSPPPTRTPKSASENTTDNTAESVAINNSTTQISSDENSAISTEIVQDQPAPVIARLYYAYQR